MSEILRPCCKVALSMNRNFSTRLLNAFGNPEKSGSFRGLAAVHVVLSRPAAVNVISSMQHRLFSKSGQSTPFCFLMPIGSGIYAHEETKTC